ncbi:hypothetical protein PFISCL1PPCAC_8264, partial [Pristionchus fissidentatus]
TANMRKRVSQRARATRRVHDGILLAPFCAVRMSTFNRLHVIPTRAIDGREIELVIHTIEVCSCEWSASEEKLHIGMCSTSDIR